MPDKKLRHSENMYNKPVKNIVDFEKTLTVEEAIARSKEKNVENKKHSIFAKKKNEEEENVTYKNQILNNFKK